MGRALWRTLSISQNRDGEGGVGIRVAWILLSLGVIAGAMVWLINYQQRSEERYSRKAVEISEYGLLHVLEKLGEKPSWRGGFPKTAYEGGWYSAKLTPQTQGDTVLLSVETTGRIGGVTKKQECLLRLSIANKDSVWVRAQPQ